MYTVQRHVHVHVITTQTHALPTKRWFLYSPDFNPLFHPDVTTLHWVTHTYPTLQEEDKPLECTLSPGEVSQLYRL